MGKKEYRIEKIGEPGDGVIVYHRIDHPFRIETGEGGGFSYTVYRDGKKIAERNGLPSAKGLINLLIDQPDAKFSPVE